MQNSDYPDEIDPIVKSVDSKNSAQSIHKYFRNMKGDRNHTRKRWIWELLQNACDASAKFATIVRKPDVIIFRHDGKPFDLNEAVHLIRHGSTKTEDDKTRGQFGSGFLTTHLLSPAIYVSGQIDDGRSFQFRLERGVDDSADEIRSKIDDACRELSESLHSRERNALNSFTTEFRYPIENGDPANSDAVSNAVKEGIKMLELCAPLVIAFNKEIKRIDIKSPEETTSFEKSDSQFLQENTQQITVSEDRNGERKNHTYVLAGSEEVSVAILTKPLNNSRVCGNMGDMPKLFLDFPLVGTENFSFPAVINSIEFDPEDNRDGVRLKETEAKSWRILEEACKLLVAILKFSATRGWRNVYSLANIPDIRERDWLNSECLREKLKVHLVEKIHDTPAVIPMDETSPISPKGSILPIAKESSGVESLWTLWDKLPGKRNNLPRQDEAIGWWNAVKTWGKIYECESSSFDGAADGHKLASYIHESTRKVVEPNQYAKIADLENLLQENVCAIEWLNQLHKSINEDNLRETVREHFIVLDQDGYLDRIAVLYRDVGIADELKNVAELLEWNIRQELRDNSILSLTDQMGAGDLDNEQVVKKLIDLLRNRGEKNPDSDFAKASAGLFRWTVGEARWDDLVDFPAFAAKNGQDSKKHVIKLQRTSADEEGHLAPILSWSDELQPYADLFPKSHILAKEFFDEMSDSDTWQTLNEKGFAKNSVLVINKEEQTFIARDDSAHTITIEDIDGTTVVHLNKIINSIIKNKSKKRACLLWRFLTEWLLKHEPLEERVGKCSEDDCDKDHKYIHSGWLNPLIDREWVPQGGNLTARVSAESLAVLFRENPEIAASNEAAGLLQAIGIAPDSLRFALAKPETRKIMTDLLVSDQLEDFLARWEDHKERQRIVRENQYLGERVEELVKEALENEGFTVNRTGTGSDYEIDAGRLELLSAQNQKWLVEVKSTRGQGGVTMTLTQAEKARDKKENYLLCIVQLDVNEPEKDVVREKMRFVQNIGDDVDKLVNDFDDFKYRRDNITADKDQGVQLSISPGTENILVKKSVWEERGFSLNKLAKKLKR